MKTQFGEVAFVGAVNNHPDRYPEQIVKAAKRCSGFRTQIAWRMEGDKVVQMDIKTI